jgi:hypothetical protein
MGDSLFLGGRQLAASRLPADALRLQLTRRKPLRRAGSFRTIAPAARFLALR